MCGFGTAMLHLADYREELLHEQSPAEARLIGALSGRLRQILAAGGLSRHEFAERAGLPLELIVAAANGYGQAQTVERVMQMALAAARAGAAGL